MRVKISVGLTVLDGDKPNSPSRLCTVVLYGALALSFLLTVYLFPV